jgi:uncharacterized protein (TIGR00375 family)
MSSFVADLHVHSHHSIATSKASNLEGFYRWAKIKGLDVVGTGDFTHPGWFREIVEKLEPRGDGFLRLKDPPGDTGVEGLVCKDLDVRFCLSAEISSIYKKAGRTRKVHSLLFAPDLETATKIGAKLSTMGNTASDGRPILGVDPKDLLELVLSLSPDCHFIPAHIWTPWFSLFGSQSGFDAVEECFEELSPHIFALETGLSSDPSMNRRWSALDGYTLVSNSDAHSPGKLGREANLFETELSYPALFQALSSRIGFAGTIEFYPEEGKYHLDGHRKCGVCLSPQDTVRHRGICPACGKKLTVGVLHRVYELADRQEAIQPPMPGEHLIPLKEILAEIHGASPVGKAVAREYARLISRFGSELAVLRKAPIEALERDSGTLLSEAVRRMRKEEIDPQPGYDGQFGVMHIFREGEREALGGQGSLFGELRAGPPGATAKRKTEPSEGPPMDLRRPAASEAQEVALRSLSPEQKRVLEFSTGCCLITAGPGTGKTGTLVAWITNLVQNRGIPPETILAVTFTNRAAGEMAARLSAGLGKRSERLRIGTFHSFCFDVIRSNLPEIREVFDESSRFAAMKLLDPSISEGKARDASPDISRHWRSSGADRKGSSGDTGKPPLPNVPGNSTGTMVREPTGENLLVRYRRLLKESGGIDVAALISAVNRLFEEEPGVLEEIRRRIRFIAIDEFQDINAGQYELIGHLMKIHDREPPQDLTDAPSLLAIGDPDQAIYGFRGSDLRYFFQFQKEYRPRILELTTNYRSSAVLCEAAGAVIAHNSVRSSIRLKARRRESQSIYVLPASNPQEEARTINATIEALLRGTSHIAIDAVRESKARILPGGQDSPREYAFSDIAVLCRTRAVRNELADELALYGVPLTVGESSSLLSNGSLAGVLHFLRLLHNPRNVVSSSALLDLLRPDLSWQRHMREPDLDSMLATFVPTGQDSRGEEELFSDQRRLRDVLEELAGVLESSGLSAVLETLWRRHLSIAGPKGIEASLRREAILSMAADFGKDLAGFLKRVSLNLYESEAPERIQKVNLLTFHASKGLEFPVVFLAGIEEGLAPILSRRVDLEEERRLFYVALSRASDLAFISHSAVRRIHGQTAKGEPSRFISEIPPQLTRSSARRGERKKRVNRQLALF